MSKSSSTSECTACAYEDEAYVCPECRMDGAGIADSRVMARVDDLTAGIENLLRMEADLS